jgi:hypothetical protein
VRASILRGPRSASASKHTTPSASGQVATSGTGFHARGDSWKDWTDECNGSGHTDGSGTQIMTRRVRGQISPLRPAARASGRDDKTGPAAPAQSSLLSCRAKHNGVETSGRALHVAAPASRSPGRNGAGHVSGPCTPIVTRQVRGQISPLGPAARASGRDDKKGSADIWAGPTVCPDCGTALRGVEWEGKGRAGRPGCG